MPHPHERPVSKYSFWGVCSWGIKCGTVLKIIHVCNGCWCNFRNSVPNVWFKAHFSKIPFFHEFAELDQFFLYLKSCLIGRFSIPVTFILKQTEKQKQYRNQFFHLANKLLDPIFSLFFPFLLSVGVNFLPELFY